MPYLAAAERLFERVEIHAAEARRCDALEGQLQHRADARMRVVRLFGGDNRLTGSELPRHPQCFQIGESSSAGQVAKMLIPAEHGGDFATASVSMRELARPPSRAWLLGLSHEAMA